MLQLRDSFSAHCGHKQKYEAAVKNSDMVKEATTHHAVKVQSSSSQSGEGCNQQGVVQQATNPFGQGRSITFFNRYGPTWILLWNREYTTSTDHFNRLSLPTKRTSMVAHSITIYVECHIS